MQAKDTTPIDVRLSVLDEQGSIVHQDDFSKEKIVIGRILSADLRVDDPRVSRIHALIEARGGDLVLTDLASSHGTYVNGKKVVETKLKFGDEIRVGQVRILFEKGEGGTNADKAFEGRPVLEGEETLMEIDRSLLDDADRRRKRGPDRRKRDAFPDERRSDDRRLGDRRVNQRTGEDRRAETDPALAPKLPDGVTHDRRKRDRRASRQFERRIGDRRRGDRRVFDITSLERRISDRRTRNGDEDLLPDELEKAFAPPEHSRELEVTVLWGEHILDVSNYRDPSVITVGESPRNHYIIPSEGIGDEFPLITIEEDGTAYLAFTETMTGTIRARDHIYTIAELIEAKFVRKMADYYVVALKRDDFAKLSIGTVNFFVLYVKPAPRPLPPPLFHREPLLMRTTIGSLLLLALLLVGVSFIDPPKPVTIEMIPERFARIVIKKRPKIPDAVVSPKKTEQQGGSEKGQGTKSAQAEGKAGDIAKPKVEKQAAPKTPKTPQKKVATSKPAAPRTPRKVVDKQKAKSVGLLKAFKNSNLKSNVSKLTNNNSSSGFESFGKAVSGLRSKGLESSGAGGKGLKGVNVGGGGKTIGIDGPSTQGIGAGGSGKGFGEGLAGPGRLGIKGEHSVSIVSENVQVLSGLPKDVINAVVQRHRSEIRACYDAALQRNPSLRGKVVVAFTIQPNGIVSSSTVKESSIPDSALGRCITARVRSWKFPKPEAPVVTEVSAYPFYLNPAN